MFAVSFSLVLVEHGYDIIPKNENNIYFSIFVRKPVFGKKRSGKINKTKQQEQKKKRKENEKQMKIPINLGNRNDKTRVN